jgi:thiosulfate/3-mercaptopyruvate sulfurtransferase
MRVASLLVRSLCGLCVIASVATAQSTSRDAMLVTPAWLATHLHDQNLVILHVGPPEKYAAKHIPGARFIDLDDISVTDRTGMRVPPGVTLPPQRLMGPKNGLILEMPTPEQLRSQLATFGISDDSRVVVYDSDQWISPSTRVFFTLKYAGLGAHTSLLDGGLAAWTRENHEATDVVPAAAKPGKLSPLSPQPFVVDAQYVRGHGKSSGVALFDVRSGSSYDGLRPDGPDVPDRLGHIPGAKSLPFEELVDEAGRFKPADQLTAIFSKLGAQPLDTVVAYCYVGQRATAVLFAASTLGHPVRLYDGSFQEWARLTPAQFPLELPAAKAKP